MPQPQKINGARAAFSQRLHRSCRSILCKVAQERIARAQWQESQSDALDRRASRKNSVENFVSCPVAAYCKEASVALIVGFAGKLHRVPLAGRSDDVNLQSFLAQAHQRRSREFRGAAATGGGVDDGEKSIHCERKRIRNSSFRSTQSLRHLRYKGRIAVPLSSFASRSARTLRLILSEAVRGKSSSSRTTPWIRL